MLSTRREWLWLAGSTTLFAQRSTEHSDEQRRIAQVIRDYEQQGIHRTATETDLNSGDWLMGEVRKAGLNPARENFTISRVDPVTASLAVNGRRIEGVPLFDGGFTDGEGVRGRVGALASGAGIGVTEIAPNTAGRGALGEARRQNRHRAIVAITRGGRPGLCPSNAESFLKPFGPPVLQVSSEEASWLADLTRQGSEAALVAHVERKAAESFNVTATISGSDPSLPPLVIMTPRSGWWTCASERGGGIACWLELMRGLRGAKPARGVLFVASSGHELGQLGIEIYAQHHPGLIKHSRAWIHFGANIGAAQDPGNTIQASDDEMEALMAGQIEAAGLKINRRVPRGNVPGGEAGVVHREGGRYLSLIGRNALFHNPADRGPEAVDPSVIARFAAAFTVIAKTLASA
ncbi:MAG TPA: M28 family peptidase [Bryobacteraceae bacterium]|nr:M28 family peptidase [Bryobacteraceae bacterium]